MLKEHIYKTMDIIVGGS